MVSPISNSESTNFFNEYLSLPYFLKKCPPLNSSPPFSQNRGDIKYIKFEILQIVSSSEDVKFSNVRGLYLRKYGNDLERQDHSNESQILCEPTR